MHLIIGSGVAAVRAAEALRTSGYDGPLVLLGAEDGLPYERPPLSKGYLQGRTALEQLFLQPEAFYRELRIELELGQRAVALDTARREVRLEDGRRLRFEQLLIATGAAPIVPRLPGVELPGVHTLRTLEDAVQLRTHLERASRLLVVGAGLVGLEVAATACQAGKEVVLLERGPQPLQRLLPGQGVGEEVARLHREHGVTLHTGTTVMALTGTRHVEAALLSDGRSLEADLVVLAVGVRPVTDWLTSSGLPLDDGVLVDEEGRTPVPGVYAAGDVARAFHPRFGRTLRLESQGAAHTQGLAAGRVMAGRPGGFLTLPSASSEQFGVRMQVVGHPHGAEQMVVRGTPSERSFMACFLSGSRLTGVFAMNRAKELLAARRLLESGAPVSPLHLADEARPLAASE